MKNHKRIPQPPEPWETSERIERIARGWLVLVAIALSAYLTFEALRTLYTLATVG